MLEASRRSARSGVLLFVAGCAVVLASCRHDPSAAYTELAEARRLTADLRVRFTKASDASNRAVMADTDETSVGYAHEAEQATLVVQADAEALSQHLHSLEYPTEAGFLDAFDKRFAEYLKLDRVVLDLAVENTNLKAQRLAFGPAREAADGFRDALLALGTQAKDRCGFDAQVAKAVLSVRDVQVLLAPHIAESDDAAMTRMESTMNGLEATATGALGAAAAMVAPKGQAELAAASAALDRFKDVARQVVALSRRNTNVRSLALSLREKPVLTASCDDSLRALEEALAKERVGATR